MQPGGQKRDHKYLILLIFGVVFSLLSFLNHYNFRTYSFDLGINNQALYHYSHLMWSKNTVMYPAFDNILSDHFSLTPIYFSPLYWLFGSYTLLIIQIIFALIGSVGVAKFANTFSNKHTSIHMLVFLMSWGLFSALAYDYHDNTIASCVIPWFLYFVRKEKYFKSIFAVLFICTTKENMALWMAFVSLGISLSFSVNKVQRLIGLFSFVLSLGYFVLIMKVVIPLLTTHGLEYKHFHFSVLGTSFSEAIINILQNPLFYVKSLFVNHLETQSLNSVKQTTWLYFLLSGGWLLVFRPNYLIMLIPIFGQKFFNDDFLKWGPTFHYSVEFAPILACGSAEVLSSLRYSSLRRLIKRILIVGCLYSFTSNIVHPFWFNSSRINVFSLSHYKSDLIRSDVMFAISKISPNASVCAEQRFIPHIAFRDSIYSFPNDHVSPQFYLLSPNDNDDYPLSKTQIQDRIKNLLNKNYKITYKTSSIILLERR